MWNPCQELAPCIGAARILLINTWLMPSCVLMVTINIVAKTIRKIVATLPVPNQDTAKTIIAMGGMYRKNSIIPLSALRTIGIPPIHKPRKTPSKLPIIKPVKMRTKLTEVCNNKSPKTIRVKDSQTVVRLGKNKGFMRREPSYQRPKSNTNVKE